MRKDVVVRQKFVPLVLVGLLVGGTLSAAARGEEPTYSSPVAPAAHYQPVSLPSVDDDVAIISFSQQPTNVGDRVAQRVGLEMDVDTRITLAGQIAHESKTEMRKRQERRIEVLEVNDGRVVKAKVTFPLARIMSPEGTTPGQEATQPVEGNSYLVTRIDPERLKVTELSGALPTRDEFELVVQSVSTLGLSNPLAEYLLSRSIRVGETLHLPHALAQEILGFDQLGEVKGFSLALQEIRPVDDQPCAVFKARIEAVGAASSPLQINVAGEVVIELATCRTVEASLTGPMTMQVTENEVEYRADGNILLAIQSRYGTKQR